MGPSLDFASYLDNFFHGLSVVIVSFMSYPVYCLERAKGWLLSKIARESKVERLELSHFERDLHEILKDIQNTKRHFY